MTCPFCKSTDIDVPEVDIGVGMMQVGPATCRACGAFQHGATLETVVWQKAPDVGADPLGVDNVLRLCAKHINRYVNRIRLGERGDRNVRVGECRAYLALWEQIRDKGGVLKDLTPAERREVQQAVEGDE